jgi:hypothetical protein
VDVDPVVGERRILRDDQGDGEEVPVVEPGCGGDDIGGRRRVHGQQQVADRHRRHEGVARVALRPAVDLGGDGHDGVTAVVDARHRSAHHHLGSGLLHEVAAPLPHHPGAELGVPELLDETRDVGLAPSRTHGVEDRLAE